ncbi:MAG: class I SAM-dependent methyltransferase [Candidatus Heimdallarchaeota archaeon]
MLDLISDFESDLQCPKCGGNLQLQRKTSSIRCQNNDSHNFQIIDEIPRFVEQNEISPEDAKWVFDYDQRAESYDAALEFYNEKLGTHLRDSYLELADHLPVQENQSILDVSVGTGNVNLAIKQVYPNLRLKLAGIDLSIGFLQVALEKFKKGGIQSLLLHSQVNSLPFKNNKFDIITHSGGINTFSNIPRTLTEWVRVLKPEGTLVFVDEGLSPAVRKTERGESILKWNTLFSAKPPLDDLPFNVKNIKLWWTARGTFYVIICQKGEI